MNKKELTVLYNKVTAMTWEVDDNFNKVDPLALAHLLEEVATALEEVINDWLKREEVKSYDNNKQYHN